MCPRLLKRKVSPYSDPECSVWAFSVHALNPVTSETFSCTILSLVTLPQPHWPPGSPWDKPGFLMPLLLERSSPSYPYSLPSCPTSDLYFSIGPIHDYPSDTIYTIYFSVLSVSSHQNISSTKAETSVHFYSYIWKSSDTLSSETVAFFSLSTQTKSFPFIFIIQLCPFYL